MNLNFNYSFKLPLRRAVRRFEVRWLKPRQEDVTKYEKEIV